MGLLATEGRAVNRTLAVTNAARRTRVMQAARLAPPGMCCWILGFVARWKETCQPLPVS